MKENKEKMKENKEKMKENKEKIIIDENEFDNFSELPPGLFYEMDYDWEAELHDQFAQISKQEVVDFFHPSKQLEEFISKIIDFNHAFLLYCNHEIIIDSNYNLFISTKDDDKKSEDFQVELSESKINHEQNQKMIELPIKCWIVCNYHCALTPGNWRKINSGLQFLETCIVVGDDGYLTLDLQKRKEVTPYLLQQYHEPKNPISRPEWDNLYISRKVVFEYLSEAECIDYGIKNCGSDDCQKLTFCGFCSPETSGKNYQQGGLKR